MCGITGIINFNRSPVSKELLKKMTDAIAHRGPDAEGFYVDGCVGLGHRRLAIIDLSPAGNQPMISENGQFILSYNGEVYNFRELRADLEKAGYRFRSRTDSEVVLNAYLHWKQDCVKRFNGMFAFAIWDKQKQELFLARDRYGIKPLYYTFQKDILLFASEHKAFLQHPDFKKTIDLEALLEYFTFQNIFTDRTLLCDVKLFPPGAWLKISLRDQISIPNPVQYWDFNFQEPERPLKEEEYIAEVDRLFRQAVKRQLVSDVELGAYLSGGMDSGSITAIAATELPYIKTFTCGFDLSSASGLEMGFDERVKAEHMSYLFKTEHYEMVLKAGDMERILPALAWHLEEPRVGQSYPNLYMAQLASKFVKVVLSGAGGDELFAGYPWRYYRSIDADFDSYINQYFIFWQRLISEKDMERVFSPIREKVRHVHTKEIFKNVFRRHQRKLNRQEDCVNNSLYFEAKTFLQGLLIMEDKLSMARGLETRVPFLDNDLVDFAMQIPICFKIRNLSDLTRIDENEPGAKKVKYFAKTNDGKLLLRKVMQKHLPQSITSAVKQGFSAPDASWFKGESIDYVKKMLCSRNAKIYQFFDPVSTQELINEHLEGKQNRRLFIWSLLNFEHWCSAYLP